MIVIQTYKSFYYFIFRNQQYGRTKSANSTPKNSNRVMIVQHPNNTNTLTTSSSPNQQQTAVPTPTPPRKQVVLVRQSNNQTTPIQIPGNKVFVTTANSPQTSQQVQVVIFKNFPIKNVEQFH